MQKKYDFIKIKVNIPAIRQCYLIISFWDWIFENKFCVYKYKLYAYQKQETHTLAWAP